MMARRMNWAALAALSTLLLPPALSAATRTEGPTDYLQIKPTYRESNQLAITPGHNPFRRIAQLEILTPTEADNSTLTSQIKAALGNDAIGGVIVPRIGRATVMIMGEAYSANDELRITGSADATSALATYRIFIRDITRSKLVYEAVPKNRPGAPSVEVTIPLDDFYAK